MILIINDTQPSHLSDLDLYRSKRLYAYIFSLHRIAKLFHQTFRKYRQKINTMIATKAIRLIRLNCHDFDIYFV